VVYLTASQTSSAAAAATSCRVAPGLLAADPMNYEGLVWLVELRERLEAETAVRLGVGLGAKFYATAITKFL
jgi:hypothetical protein